MKTEIKKILYKFLQDGITSDDAAQQVLDLFDVVGQSEQLVCDCGNSSMTWYGNDDDKKWFCFNCKKEAN